MQDQKLENLLNLSLSVTPEERRKSQELETGFNSGERTWELIVKYSGGLDALRDMGIIVEEMLNEYAILTVPEHLVEAVSDIPQIEFIEKPKRLFFAISQARAASCIDALQLSGGAGASSGLPYLTGRGVLVAVLDSGIDYYHEDFRNADGTTRIAALWDQSLDRVFTREEINEAMASGSRALARELVPSIDLSGHGTAVAGIAAGNGEGNRQGGVRYRGVAFESELLVVKLRTAQADGFPRTTELMRGINFAVSQAAKLNMPVAVNISFGNTYGSHDGTSLLETFLDDISGYGRTTIVAGSGNEGAAQGHTGGQLVMGREERIELSVSPYETGVSVQLWKSYSDSFGIQLQAPSGEWLPPFDARLGPQRYRYENTQILVYYGKPAPYSVAQEIYMDFIPERSYIEGGIWSIWLLPERIVRGQYDLWLPSEGVLNQATRFLRPTPDTTLTIPSTAAKVITVGAYNSLSQSYADFSGRGYTRLTNQVKPDIAAPGVGIMTSAAGGGYAAVTGTSFAAPMVTGSAALLMQWGIVDRNDPFLYGEKLKAYLRRGARQLPGFSQYPNPQVGYGALCVGESLPV